MGRVRLIVAWFVATVALLFAAAACFAARPLPAAFHPLKGLRGDGDAAVGPGGSLWIITGKTTVARVSRRGVVTTFDVGGRQVQGGSIDLVSEIASGPDRTVWLQATSSRGPGNANEVVVALTSKGAFSRTILLPNGGSVPGISAGGALSVADDGVPWVTAAFYDAIVQDPFLGQTTVGGVGFLRLAPSGQEPIRTQYLADTDFVGGMYHGVVFGGPREVWATTPMDTEEASATGVWRLAPDGSSGLVATLPGVVAMAPTSGGILVSAGDRLTRLAPDGSRRRVKGFRNVFDLQRTPDGSQWVYDRHCRIDSPGPTDVGCGDQWVLKGRSPWRWQNTITRVDPSGKRTRYRFISYRTPSEMLVASRRFVWLILLGKGQACNPSCERPGGNPPRGVARLTLPR